MYDRHNTCGGCITTRMGVSQEIISTPCLAEECGCPLDQGSKTWRCPLKAIGGTFPKLIIAFFFKGATRDLSRPGLATSYQHLVLTVSQDI
jgi:hypothetical protein